METLKDILLFIGVFVGYVIIVTRILPRFGVPT